ncbi:MAG: lactaldehyde reductase [Erysipelotrichaceae bacterium]
MSRFILNEVSHHGKGALAALESEVKAFGFKKAFICTDKDLVKFGVVDKVTKKLDAFGFPYVIFDDTQANPTISNVKDGVAAYKASGADFIITVGGGSPQDTAKAIGIIIANPDFSDVVSLEGLAETKNKSIPVFAIPTTAGTASEVTINYVLTVEETKRKIVCVDPHCIPAVAFVDPEMMASMPKGLAAATGMDALTHAIEGYITKGANEMSDMFHAKSIELIAKSLKAAVNGDEKAQENMALAQYIAGMGFSNVGLGAVHSMAHPLGALYNTPHGIANAILLPTVMEYNATTSGEKYREIARLMGVSNVDAMSQDEYRKAAVDAVKQLSSDVGIIASLADIVLTKDLDFLAESALADACMPSNPRDLSAEEVISLYQKLM